MPTGPALRRLTPADAGCAQWGAVLVRHGVPGLVSRAVGDRVVRPLGRPDRAAQEYAGPDPGDSPARVSAGRHRRGGSRFRAIRPGVPARGPRMGLLAGTRRPPRSPPGFGIRRRPRIRLAELV